MGLPVGNLIIATNRNDVLHDALIKGQYSQKSLHKTLSPSMDISVSSNFERLLFDLYGKDGAQLKQMMESFSQKGISIEDSALKQLRDEFRSHAVDDDNTCEIIRAVYESSGYLLDPHTATGIGASSHCRESDDEIIVNLATAHPAKFPEAVERAGLDVVPEVPSHMSDLFQREEHFDVLENSTAAINDFMISKL